MSWKRHVVTFLWRTVLTWDFWTLFLASFTCVLMMAWRSSIRDNIFKAAQKTVGKRGW